MGASLGELAVRFGCELRGDPQVRVDHVATLAGAQPGALAFLANPRYRGQLATTHASAVVLDAASVAAFSGAVLISANPYVTYARIAALLHPPAALPPGIHASALVDSTARVDPSAHVGAFAHIGAGAQVGPRAGIGPHCTLAEGVQLAADVQLVARVHLGPGVRVGERSVLQPGVVVGADGFGFAPERGRWVKVPQLGSVQIGADVEIGANTTVDRGAIEDTVIEEGVKLDNLIQIAHNVRVGAHTVIAACTGVSGSTSIGRRCVIGGSVGFAGHISIADDVVVSGFSMISRSIEHPGVYSSGIPFEEARIWRRMVAHFKRLGGYERRVRALERSVGLTAQKESDES
ncbi:MAG: UDP-3-O-(3-hydroxymyristoyl)glucosamine N-acyltransferase [Proteobacteria bacterium]|nr:UDP-3-O-(3-hydroxymyristoyl)glucosamine N-acyltransferase [Pseudomonadota bacterium]